MQNVVASAVVSCEGNYIQIKDLPEYLVTLSKHNLSTAFDSIGTKTLKLNDLVSQLEKEAIIAALKKAGNNKTKAIKLLGLSRSAFYYKLARTK